MPPGQQNDPAAKIGLLFEQQYDFGDRNELLLRQHYDFVAQTVQKLDTPSIWPPHDLLLGQQSDPGRNGADLPSIWQ